MKRGTEIEAWVRGLNDMASGVALDHPPSADVMSAAALAFLRLGQAAFAAMDEQTADNFDHLEKVLRIKPPEWWPK